MHGASRNELNFAGFCHFSVTSLKRGRKTALDVTVPQRDGVG